MSIKLIAHRGNINGPNPLQENNPEYLISSINLGFDVECDIRIIDNKIYLGHDEPQYEIQSDFLDTYKDKLWCHAKNKEALEYLLSNEYHTFWHQNDDYTITSKGIIWAYPNKFIHNCIIVMPELYDTIYNKNEILGICSDYLI